MPAAAILAKPIPVTAPAGDTKPVGRAADSGAGGIFADMISAKADTDDSAAASAAQGRRSSPPAFALHPLPTTQRLTSEAADEAAIPAPSATSPAPEETPDTAPTDEVAASTAAALPDDGAEAAVDETAVDLAPTPVILPTPADPVVVIALQAGAGDLARAAARSIDLEDPQAAADAGETAPGETAPGETEPMSPQLASPLAGKAAPLKDAPANASTSPQGATAAASALAPAAASSSATTEAADASTPASPTAAAAPASASPEATAARAAASASAAALPPSVSAETPLQGDAPAPSLGSAAPAAASVASPSLMVAPNVSQMSQAALDTTVQIAAQITRKLEGRSTRFEMGLTPEGLGRVNISLDIDSGGKLTARLAFDNPLAATEMRGKADELRRELQDAGFTIANDGLEFSDRQSAPGGGFDRRQGQAFAGASRINAEADQTQPAPAAWMSLTLRPRGVDMKV